MRLYLLFLILNTFYKNVEPLSIFVKIEWQQDWENKFNYSDYLSGKITERFELKLTRNLFGDVNEFDGKTDGYDTYHFTGSDAIGEAQWIYNLNISIDGFQIIDPFKVENNSIVYIALSKDNAKYKILKKSQELSHFDAIINLFKNPIRFLQFVLRKRGEEVEDIRVLCKDVEQNIAELVKVFKGEKENYNSRREYRSNCVRIKVCPNNSYILFSHGKHLVSFIS
uniref:Uncharacterized protein n=1 Tax=Meloidogyne hapla TaxID=6305 RepID=A0A1I8B991_MELHA